MCNIDKVYGDWRINKNEYVFNIALLYPFLKNKKLVKFTDIGWKGKNLKFNLNIDRYKAADIGYPCILTEGQNPYNCKYRMLDGKHRINKMINMGMSESLFYVVDYNIFSKLLLL